MQNRIYALSGVQYYTAHCRSSLGLQAKGYNWPYIPPLVLIRIQFILTQVTIQTFSIKIPVLSFLESNIGRVDSLYISGSWGYIFLYTPSSTESTFFSTLHVELDLYGKMLPSWCALLSNTIQPCAVPCSKVHNCAILCISVQQSSVLFSIVQYLSEQHSTVTVHYCVTHRHTVQHNFLLNNTQKYCVE